MSAASVHVLTRDPAPVSVVIPCYRCADTIGRALASVFQQTWRPTEVILVEDGSGDSTLKYLHELQTLYPEGWLHVLALPQNAGPGAARNTGWDKASQPYLAFLDADDAWHSEKIRLQLEWMLAHPEAVLTGHDISIALEESAIKTAHAIKPLTFEQVSAARLLISNCFATPTVILRRDLPNRFASDKRHIEDQLLFTEICLDGYPCYRSAAALSFLFKAQYGEAGLSANLWQMEKGELDFYIRLARSGRIPRLSLLLFMPFSLAKYARRLLKVAFRRLFRQ
ncbi:MAG: glycosyltransferase [Zoogloeaceae bacterium]|nr:glycosyltransferase [Zoogloeaceae bacterium]